jgi:hypothetical protein
VFLYFSAAITGAGHGANRSSGPARLFLVEGNHIGKRASSKIMSEAFSPIMIVEALVLPVGSEGMIAASTTRSRSTPHARNRGSTSETA